ncbi:MAG: 2-hydroxyacyl-CoA dehydratase [Spirochaetales bacterium]|nr:2-hydroxyacyl-CoA dehydratase [Spirochaetales bacterium]MBR2317372.1 2-hydroxyacyl-CoA dehydratase [Spirochaetales bacterium]
MECVNEELNNRERDSQGRVLFTKDMKDFTILIPMMLPIHFTLIKNVFNHAGYNMELLTNSGSAVVQEGLKYVHNDTCYPALLVIGQFIDALKSGKYDVTKVALIITQTGGGCRASNYIHLLRKALDKAGFGFVPVISLNFGGLEKNAGFKLTIPILRRAIAALAYGDVLMTLNNQVKAYEDNPGETQKLTDEWVAKLAEEVSNDRGLTTKEMEKNLHAIIKSFSNVPRHVVPKVKVGIVGEIFVKYSGLGNNELEAFLASQDCEVMVPGLMGFMLFKIDNRLEDIRLYGGSRMKKIVVSILMQFFTKMETLMIDIFKDYPQFIPPSSYKHTKSLVKGMIGYGNKMGEGWLLTAEILELIELGYANVVCTQPFGCLPNHICAKGMIHKIRERYNDANIVAVDYDPGATKVNQENRIKLMLSIARENLAGKNKSYD